MTAQRNWASGAIFPAHKAHVRTEILEAHYAATAPPPHLTRTSPFPFPQPTKTHHPIPLSSSLSSPLPASHCNPNPPQSPTPLPPPWARPTPTPSKSPATLLSPSSCGLGRWKRGPICLRFFFFFFLFLLLLLLFLMRVAPSAVAGSRPPASARRPEAPASPSAASPRSSPSCEPSLPPSACAFRASRSTFFPLSEFCGFFLNFFFGRWWCVWQG